VLDEGSSKKFVQIRAVDDHSEIMDIQGELKIATFEIKRLREQLMLIEGERTTQLLDFDLDQINIGGGSRETRNQMS